MEADEDVVSDPELITRVRAGDRAAFGELYRRHSGPATTLARQFARSAAESDDLVSESFARVLDNLLSGKGPDTAFRAYLFTTIRNTAYDRTRKDKRLQFTDDMTTHDVAVVGDDPVLAKMESGLVATAFAQLPERWQAVLWHTQVEGETPAQVGALLGMAPGAVSSLAFRAREGLREAYLQAHLAETAAEQCRKTVESLGAWTRGGLSKREKAQVDAHLETCDRCRALAAELEEVNSGLRGLLAPLLLGGAAAGYLATLGPVAPLAAPGTLAAGAAAAGAAGSGGAGGTAGGGGAAGGGAAGGGVGAAGAGVGAAGGSAAATSGAAAAAGAGAAVAAGAVAAGAVGAAAYASTQAGGSTAGGAGAAGGTAAGGAAAGAGAGGAAAGGLAGVVASIGVGGLVAAGAAVLIAAVAAVVFVVSGNSPETITAADQDGTSSQSVGGSSDANDPAAGSGAATSAGAGASAGSPATGTEPGTEVAGTGATTATGADIPAGDAALPGSDTQANDAAAADVPAGDVLTPGATSTTSTADSPSTSSQNDAASTGPTSTTEPSSSPPDTSNTSPSPPLTPFAIVVSPFTMPTLTAGTAGSISVTVGNTGDQGSPTQPLTVTVPAGVQVTGVDAVPGGAALRRASLLATLPCTPSGSQTCTSELPEIAGHASLVVTVTLAVAPTAVDGSVAIQVGTFDAQSSPLTVGSPITSLSLNTDAALVAGTTNPRTITVGTAEGVTDAGPITFASTNPDITFGNPTSCDPPTGDTSISCTGASINLSIVIADRQLSGSLPITATDAGGRPLDLALKVVTPTPADLQLSPLTVSEPLIAGGGGQLALTVTNTGGVPSTEQTIDAGLPDGVTVTGVSAGGTPLCRSVGADCLLPPIDADGSVSLLLDLHVCRCVSANPLPPATVTIGGIDGVFATRQLTVQSGIATLSTVPDGPFVAGGRYPLTITAARAGGVTNPGKVIFTSTSKFVSFTDAKNCVQVNPGGGGTSAIKCDGTAFPMTIVIGKDQPPGDLPIRATDAGQRTLPLLDSDGRPMQVLAPGRLQLSELTAAKGVQAGGSGSLTLTVTNPNPGLSERMPIGITLDNELILFHLSGLGTGPLSGNCGPFWGTTCRLPAIGTQPRKLTFIVVAPRSARSGTLSVTIDQTTRSNTFGVSPPPATDALGLTLGPPAESAAESAPTTTRSADGDLNADAELAPGPRNTGASSMASPSDEHSATSAPPTSGGSATTTAPPTASWPATTGSTNTTSAAPPPPGDAVPVGGTDLPQTSATIGTGAPPDVPPSGEALATTGPPGTPEETGAGDPVTTAPAPANVRLSAPRGGEQFSPGGALALSFTATNNGGARSAATPIILALPDGVEVERVTVDGSAACATGGGCLLPALQPGGEVHVTVELSAGAGASGGAALITVDGSGVGWRVNVWSPASPPTDQRTTNQPAAEPTTSQRATDPQPTGIVTSH